MNYTQNERIAQVAVSTFMAGIDALITPAAGLHFSLPALPFS